MKYVYLLESLHHPDKRYVGVTANLDERLARHNARRSPHTSKFAPWKCKVAIRFANEAKADGFETYLKSGSGHAFARRHFW